MGPVNDSQLTLASKRASKIYCFACHCFNSVVTNSIETDYIILAVQSIILFTVDRRIEMQ